MSGNQKGSAAESTLHQKGMKTQAAAATDSSMKCKGGSVNDEATRDSTAKTPKGLGPRCA